MHSGSPAPWHDNCTTALQQTLFSLPFSFKLSHNQLHVTVQDEKHLQRHNVVTLPTSSKLKKYLFSYFNLLLSSTRRVKGLLVPHTFTDKQNHLYILKYIFLHISWKNLQMQNKCSNTTWDHRSSVEQWSLRFKTDYQNTTEKQTVMH